MLTSFKYAWHIGAPLLGITKDHPPVGAECRDWKRNQIGYISKYHIYTCPIYVWYTVHPICSNVPPRKKMSNCQRSISLLRMLGWFQSSIWIVVLSIELMGDGPWKMYLLTPFKYGVILGIYVKSQVVHRLFPKSTGFDIAQVLQDSAIMTVPQTS